MNMTVLIEAEEQIMEPLCITEGPGSWCCRICHPYV
jgi:hypothetical protein